MKPRPIAAIVLAFGIVVAAVPAARAEPVAVQATARADMGRIVFSWNTPVAFDSQVAGGRLTLTFRRPIEADYGRVTRVLGKYVRAVTPGADGRSVTFTLKGDVDAYAFDSGSAVIVEIVAKAAKAKKAAEKPADTAAEKPAAGKPEAAAPEKASGLPTVRVRAGRHPDYTRLVFDWPRGVPYSVKHDGGVATITFRRAAALDLSALTPPPPFVGGARTRVGTNEVTVTLAVPKSSTLKHFLAGTKVVVDIGRPSGGDKAGPLPAAAPPAVETAKPTPPKTAPPPVETATPTPTPPASPAAAPTATAAASAAARAETPAPAAAGETAPPAAAAPTRLTPRPATPAAPLAITPTPPPAAAPSAATAAAPAATSAPTATAPAAATAPARALSPPAPVAARPAAPPGAPAGALVPPPQAVVPAATQQARPAAAVAAPPPPATPPTAPGDAVTLRFDWKEPVGAAVFRRAGTLWVAFDKAAPIDVGAQMKAGGNLIRGIEQMGTSNGTVLRIATVGGVNPSLRRDGLAWLLDFRKQPLEPETPLTITAQPDSPVGARLFVPVPEPGRPIAVIDPEVGDNLVIVPVIPLGQGMAFEYVYPQMRFLPTAQGVVVTPTADDIRVNPMREGVEVTSVTQLQISAVSAEEAARAKLGALKPLSRVLKLDPWEIKSLAAYTPRRQALEVAAAMSENEKRYHARLNLARFYFANGFDTEALGVLERIGAERPEAQADPEYRVLRGGAEYMLGRLEAAAGQFGDKSLRNNDEAMFWLAATRATLGDMEGAAPELKRTGTIIRQYPKSLKVPLGVVVTETALSQGDLKQAKHFIEILRIDKLTAVEKAKLDYEDGRVLAQEGKVDEAVAKYESVIRGPDRPSRVKAVVARAELLLKEGRINRAQAIAELEKVRYAWRGDAFEFRLLRRLGQLYIAEKLYRQGLTAYREAAIHFRTSPEAPAITQAMSDTFSDLFLKGKADEIAPLTALAVYDEFKELTPAGSRGDEMIRRLADRLVGVDLIDRAAKLLDNQVKFRLQGVDKARVGAQLALIHMLGREYDKALQALDETQVAAMPAALEAQRRHLRAKAEIGKGQPQRALDVLAGDASRDAELLRTEVFWNARDWNNAAQTLRRLLRLTGARPGQPLDNQQASDVLNFAVALTLGGNERALARVRDDYQAAMDKTPLKEPFDLVATAPAKGLVRPEDVGRIVKQVEQFKSFLTAYRERLKNEPLSEIVPGTGVLDAVTPDKAAKTPAKTPAVGTPPAASPGAPAGTPPAAAPPPAAATPQA